MGAADWPLAPPRGAAPGELGEEKKKKSKKKKWKQSLFKVKSAKKEEARLKLVPRPGSVRKCFR